MSASEKGPIPQASAVPYRHRNGAPEFCLITSAGKGRWGFPKGIIDPGETPIETVLREAEEEAGLHGHVEPRPLGEYEYHKWGASLLVTVYLMQVTDVDDDWEEARWRQRRWCSAGEARSLIDRQALHKSLVTAIKRLVV